MIYTDDFYKDFPAVTVRKTGKGKAFYQAARCDEASLVKLLDYIVKSEEISGEKPVPGVERHVRYSKEYAYIFYLNDSDAAITLNNLDGIDLVTGESIDGCIRLMPKESIVIKKGTDDERLYTGL